MPYLTTKPIDTSELRADILRSSDGACCVFEGIVRDHHEGRVVESILYEAYESMADKEIAAIVTGIEREFAGARLAVLHRLGRVLVGEVSISIICVAPHRAEAFAACRAAIDRIKAIVPIWKKERGPDGEEWVGWQK